MNNQQYTNFFQYGSTIENVINNGQIVEQYDHVQSNCHPHTSRLSCVLANLDAMYGSVVYVKLFQRSLANPVAKEVAFKSQQFNSPLKLFSFIFSQCVSGVEISRLTRIQVTQFATAKKQFC